jgi:hypothetical protein
MSSRAATVAAHHAHKPRFKKFEMQREFASLKYRGECIKNNIGGSIRRLHIQMKEKELMPRFLRECKD